MINCIRPSVQILDRVLEELGVYNWSFGLDQCHWNVVVIPASLKTDSIRSQFSFGGEHRVDVWEPFCSLRYDKLQLTSAVNVVEMWL